MEHENWTTSLDFLSLVYSTEWDKKIGTNLLIKDISCWVLFTERRKNMFYFNAGLLGLNHSNHSHFSYKVWKWRLLRVRRLLLGPLYIFSTWFERIQVHVPRKGPSGWIHSGQTWSSDASAKGSGSYRHLWLRGRSESRPWNICRLLRLAVLSGVLDHLQVNKTDKNKKKQCGL